MLFMLVPADAVVWERGMGTEVVPQVFYVCADDACCAMYLEQHVGDITPCIPHDSCPSEEAYEA